MTILIVVAIVASMLGSILWLMPSKRDQDRMKLRLLARKSQLGVQLTHIELPDKWDKSTTKVKVTAYHKFRINKLKALDHEIGIYPYEVWKHEKVTDNWYSAMPIPLSDKSAALLENKMDAFKAIQITKDAVSLYWDERGDESDIVAIQSLLNELEAIEGLY
ncbi:hypothetical protein MED121_00405 [Marinomonas sp. MED121]|uniref:hypothetical protein n=1 Tax=Marinomonas sp. MED121 TaxID=314277 RepID=UPI00006905AA|nr:hypothetical protein [Marinomonas sp. MED121]EAQ63623.1 hypothetical protein MED121_00405 [Marinomonas sp. MED121]